MTNDKNQPAFTLTVTGFVESFVEIMPRSVVLKGSEGKPITSRVFITTKDKYPFNLVEIKAKHGKFIKFRIEEETHSPLKRYVLTIENVKTDKGRYADVIYLKTDSNIKPVMSIPVVGIIYEKG